MKAKLLFLALFFTSINTFAGISPCKPKFKPDSTISYTGSTGNYTITQTQSFKYDAQGRITSAIQYMMQNQPITKVEMTYSGNNTYPNLFLRYQYQNNQWDLTERATRNFDAFGNLISHKMEFNSPSQGWSISSWDSIAILSRNANNLPLSFDYYSYNGNSLSLYYRTDSIRYNAQNIPTQCWQFSQIGTNWSPSVRFTQLKFDFGFRGWLEDFTFVQDPSLMDFKLEPSIESFPGYTQGKADSYMGSWMNASQRLATYVGGKLVSCEDQNWPPIGGTNWSPFSKRFFSWTNNTITGFRYGMFNNGQFVNSDSASTAYDINGNTIALANYSFSNGAWTVNNKKAFRWNFINPSAPRYRITDDLQFGQIASDSTVFLYQTVTSVPEKENKRSATLWPNPSNGNFQLQLPDQNKTVKVRMMDAQGRLFTEINTEPSQSRLEINSSGWTPGIYFIQVESETSTEVLRFVRN